MPTAIAVKADTPGGRVRDARRAAGLTQDQLAEKAQISQGHISRIERNIAEPSTRELIRIATAVDATVAVAIGWYRDNPGFLSRLEVGLADLAPLAA
jgi:transcriptional regulator with XRE-family HTH domain